MTAGKFLVIPGNHDVFWSAEDFELGTQARYEGRLRHFKSMLEALGLPLIEGGGLISLFSISLRSSSDEGPRARFERFGDPQEVGAGYVLKSSLDHGANLLAADEVMDGVESVTTWLALHHHVVPHLSASGDVSYSRSPIIGNAPELLGRIREWKAEVVLHGHQHGLR